MGRAAWLFLGVWLGTAASVSQESLMSLRGAYGDENGGGELASWWVGSQPVQHSAFSMHRSSLPFSEEEDIAWLEMTPSPEYNLNWQLPHPLPRHVAFWMDAQTDPLQGLVLACHLQRKQLQLRQQTGDQVVVLLEADLPSIKAGDRLTLQRRADRLALLLDGRPLLRTDLFFPSEGAIGWGPPPVGADPPSYQPVEPVYFSDDFMREAQELGGWEVVRGEGEIRALKNVDRSANAFTLFLSPQDRWGLAVAGQPFWSDYRLSASIQPHEPGGGVGLVYHWQDDRNFSLVRWLSRSNQPEGRIEWVQVTQGRPEVLFAVPASLRPEAWYRLEIWSTQGRLQLRKDGELLWDLPDVGFGEGRVGLYVEAPTTADFDDVQVVGARQWTETFDRLQPLRWQVRQGKPRCQDGALYVQGPVLLLAGSQEWLPQTVEVCLRETKGSIGLLLGAQEEEAVWLLRTPQSWEWRRGSLESPGELLSSLPVRGEPLPLQWRIHAYQRWLAVESEGTILLEASPPGPIRGRIGLWTDAGAIVERISVSFQEERYPPDPTITAVFASDPYMVAWANPKGQWVPLDPVARDDPDQPGRFQHKSMLFGDWLLRLPLQDLGARQGRLDVSLGSPAVGGSPVATLQLEIERDRLRWQVQPQPGAPAEGAWAFPPGLENAELRIERCGRFLTVGVDDQQLALYPVFDKAETP